jgi:hypothetical protein
MVAKRERWLKPDVNQVEEDLQVTDEAVRSRAVGGLCPCHAGWDLFEDKVDVVIQSLRDPSRAVRRSALHVLEDAAVMQSREDLKYYLKPGEEKIGEKRALHFRPMERRLEARAKRKIQRRKRRNRIRHQPSCEARL